MFYCDRFDYINKIMGGTKMGKYEKAPKAL